MPEIFGKWNFIIKWQIWSLSQPIWLKVKRNSIFLSHLQVIGENNVYISCCFIKCGNHIFIFKRVFHWFLLIVQILNYPLEVPNSPYMFEKSWGGQIAVSVQYSRMYNIEESRMCSTYDYIALTGKSNVYIQHFIFIFITVIYFLSINLYLNSAEYKAIWLWKLSKSGILIFLAIEGFWNKLFVLHTTILHKPENTKCCHKWHIQIYCTDMAIW